ncbi:MAG TPA: helix-turn-helix transcriptional regulator [Verrucomicrobiae bacterium]|nr:helix-turn-helix transcriptional regulator [Verrucomicrobiae bacterium]
MLRLIGANVKAARSKANLTQECLAEIAGVHWQTVSYIENGRYLSSIVTFVKISQALGVSPNSLLDGLPPMNQERANRIKKAMVRKRKPRK